MSQNRLYFPEFNPEAPDLDLVITASEKLDIAIFMVTAEIPGVV